LAVCGRLALGPNYRPSTTLGVSLAPDHRLVTTGPFAIIRHPMYAGLMLAAIGSVGLYRTWSTVLFVSQLPVLVIRAKREEELLARTFGEAWERYAARVPPWLPRLRVSRPRPAPHTRSSTVVSADVEVFVARDPETVFDYFVDLRNEPQYNRQVRAITKSSPGPIGPDTTFEGRHSGFGSVTWRLSEYARPRHVVIEGDVGGGTYRWTSDLEAVTGGTRMEGHMEWRPPPRWRPLRHVLSAILAWNARRSFNRMAEVLRPATDGSSR
jgi:hypothetical protein